MIQVDLHQTASLGSMQRLGDIATTFEMASGLGDSQLERAGREPTTPPEAFEGRQGYDPNFLEGWTVALPLLTGERAADMRTLRGSDDVELRYQHFSVIISAERRMPLLTAANIDGQQSKRLPRLQVWKFDGRLEKDEQWGDAIYDGNALDRGHMVRREDPIWGSLEIARQANADTFHFTNACPQIAGVNQRTWLGLEDYVLQHAREDEMRVSVFTGPFFSDSDLEYKGAKIPLAFWKVVAIVTESGRPSATAYKVSQERELSEFEFVYAGYKTYQISIRQVMEATGLDLGNLLEFDGFSQHEHESNEPMVERLDDWTQIRI